MTAQDMVHEGDGQVGYLSPDAASTQFMGGVISGKSEDE